MIWNERERYSGKAALGAFAAMRLVNRLCGWVRRGLRAGFAALAVTAVGVSASDAGDEGNAANPWDKWSLAVFGGIGTDGSIEDLPGISSEFQDSYFMAIAANRALTHYSNRVVLEAEGQLVKHVGKQDHLEVNALLVLRWLPFPWDDTVETSFAIGDGLSYATEIPVIERERSPDKTSHLLNHLMIELELAEPKDPHWSFVARLHHRSGVYGLFNGVGAGSNFYAVGAKYRF